MQLLRNDLTQAADSAFSYGLVNHIRGNNVNQNRRCSITVSGARRSRAASIARVSPVKTKGGPRSGYSRSCLFSGYTMGGHRVYRQRALGKRFRGRFPKGHRIPTQWGL